MVNDRDLIARVLSSDDHYAFSCLVAKYQSGIRHLLRRLCAGDHHLADDLAQETFITLYRKLSTFRGDAALNTWLHKIAYNHFFKSQQKSYLKHEDIETDIDLLKSPMNGPDKDIAVEQLMAKLSIPERTCITLSASAGMSHPEIAEIIDLPLGTVKSHINRAKQRLISLVQRKQYNGENNE